MAPCTFERAPFKKNSRPDARAVLGGHALDFKNRRFFDIGWHI